MTYKQKYFSLDNILKEYNSSGLNYKMPVMLGVNTFDNNEYADMVVLKNIIIGGATGSGKSNFIHTIISSLITRFTPNEMKILLIDMKRVEMGLYNGLPHLFTDFIVESKQAVYWLKKVFEEKKQSMSIHPYTLIVIDTHSDIMISPESNEFIQLILQVLKEGPDLGIYLIMCDSRVGPDVFPKVFIDNFNTHICFNVASKEGSKTLINSEDGAYLLGRGDMLFKTESKELKRIQAPFITEKEILNLVNSFKK